MPLKLDLLQKGYLPENLPPCFDTEEIGQSLFLQSGFLSDARKAVRAASFNSSKRGMTRREFQLVHPATAHDMAHFLQLRETDINSFFTNSNFSFSRPEHTPDGDRAVRIPSHSELEEARLSRLAQYRFVAKTDISRFYHSIYSHSIPWAVHGKAASKNDRAPASTSLFANRLDFIVRTGQDGQTIGLPVGPDSSRYVAEIIGTAIDQEFVRRVGNLNCQVIRHVDDIWIGANTHADAETALWRYREAIRAYELDINESKTAILSDNFSFSDSWPTEIDAKFEFAEGSIARRIPERLIAALEYAFTLTARNNDDGILKYTLRYIDRNDFASTHWPVVEPFLKRAAVHYGHTIDYVARIIVWRHLAFANLDIDAWRPIILSVLDRHGRLGNDGEVSWALYAALRLEVRIPLPIATFIMRNCGPLSALALLSCVEEGIVPRRIFETAQEIIATEDANGSYWPLILEWRSKRWPNFRNIGTGNSLIQDLVNQQVTLFDAERLPAVFQNLTEDEFETVNYAIERRASQYDDEEDEEEEEEEEEQEEDIF